MPAARPFCSLIAHRPSGENTKEMSVRFATQEEEEENEDIPPLCLQCIKRSGHEGRAPDAPMGKKGSPGLKPRNELRLFEEE